MSFWDGVSTATAVKTPSLTPEDFGRLSLAKTLDTQAPSPFSFNPQLDNQNASRSFFSGVGALVSKVGDVLDRISGGIISPMAGAPLERVDGKLLPQKFSSQVMGGSKEAFGEKIGTPIGIGLGIIGDPLNFLGGGGKVPKALEALANEAKKFKTAEEFAKNLLQKEAVVKKEGFSSLVDFYNKATGKEVAKETVPAVKATQERGFVTSVKETAPELGDRVSGQYVPRSTDELAIKAKNLITSDINTAEKLARTGLSDKAVATASELVKKYTGDAEIATDEAVKNTLYDKAATIANDAARNLTEQGRAVQAATILGRLTPEGMARFAAREIQKFNEGAPIAKRIPELSPKQLQDIVSRMKEIAGMPDGIEKSKAFREVQDYVSRLTPSPLYAKLITIWKAGLLTGIKTSGLNTASNLFHGVSEIAKDIPAAAVDSVASLFTGKRTLALTTKGTGGGLKEGVQKGWDYLTTGYDARDTALKLDYNKVHFGDSFFAKAIQKYEETVFHVLGAEDQPFYYGAKARSIASQAIAEAKNQGLKGTEKAKFVDDMLQNPTDDILRNATADAEMAVFQNSTVLGRIAKSIQNVPGGEIVVPFGRTPAAVATQLINYSPLGIVKTIGEQIANKKFDQRLLSQGIGRAVTGTGALWLGTQLFKHDMISLGYPTDERTQKLWDAEGRKANTIKLDGKWRAVSTLGPLGYALVVGGYFAQGVKENGSIFSGLANAAAGAGKSLTDQTFLRGVDQLVKAISDPVNSAGTYFKGLIASVIPTIVSDVARGTDTKERRTPGLTDTLKSRIPGVREGLQPQVNTFGQEVHTPDFFTTMLDPTRPSIASNDPVITELRRLADVGYKVTPTQLGNKNGYPVLTAAQNTKLWEDSGSLLKTKLNSLLAAPEYQKASDEEKSNLIEDFTTKAKLIARASMVLELTHGLTGQPLKDELSKLKSGKFLTQDVFKKYLELR